LEKTEVSLSVQQSVKSKINKKHMVLQYSGSDDFRTWQCQSRSEISITDVGNSSCCV